MALDAALAIRVGSASLFVLLGLAVMAVSRKRKGGLALGASLAGFGLFVISNNLDRAEANLPMPVKVACALVAGMGGLLASVWFPTTVTPHERRAVVYGWFVGAVSTALVYAQGLDALDVIYGLHREQVSFPVFVTARIFGGSVLLASSTLVAVISARAAVQPPGNRAGWFGLAATAASIGWWRVFQEPTVTQDPMNAWSLVATVALVVGVTAPWLLAAHRSHQRFPLWMALTWPTLAFAAYAYQLVPENGAAFLDPWGMLGVIRLVGWSFLVWAILRLDLLRVPLPHFVVNRGAVAAGALATLFIVAQVAQNFFSAEYGLLTGGVMAGAFVFAASPIQRAFERMGERRPAGRRTEPTRGRSKQQEEAFREAVQLAFKDRRFSPEEELALARLADRIGVTAEHAVQIRHAVEREKGVL